MTALHLPGVRGLVYAPRHHLPAIPAASRFAGEIRSVSAPEKPKPKAGFLPWLTMLLTLIGGGSGYAHLNTKIEQAKADSTADVVQLHQSLASERLKNIQLEQQLQQMNGQFASVDVFLKDAADRHAALLKQQAQRVQQLNRNLTRLNELNAQQLTLSDVAKVIEQVAPANVMVQTPLGGGEMATGSGTWLKAQDGKLYILTNHHVVDGAVSENGSDVPVFKIRLFDGQEQDSPQMVQAEQVKLKGNTLAQSEKHDLALLEVTTSGFHLPTNIRPLTFRDTVKEPLRVGEFVIVVGSPYRLSDNVTFGIISHVDRHLEDLEPGNTFVGVDAPINPGNSGGALYDMKGRYIGPNTAGMRNADGLGFAVRTDVVKKVLADWGIMFSEA